MTLCAPCYNYEHANPGKIDSIEYNPRLTVGETCGKCGDDHEAELETMDVVTVDNAQVAEAVATIDRSLTNWEYLDDEEKYGSLVTVLEHLDSAYEPVLSED